VNVVLPGFTVTERNRQLRGELIERTAAMTLTGRLSTPEDVARLIVFLGSGANRSVTGEVVHEGSATTRSAHGALAGVA
jgi:3-oxoacyl-[acyl-carrier protein] reductase